MHQKISDVEWWLLLGWVGLIDFVQIILDIFAIGLAANRIIDICVGVGIFLYALIRGQMDQKILLAMLATFGAEEIPLVDIAPFWVVDVWYMRMRYKQKEAQKKEEEEAQAAAATFEQQQRIAGRNLAMKSGAGLESGRARGNYRPITQTQNQNRQPTRAINEAPRDRVGNTADRNISRIRGAENPGGQDWMGRKPTEEDPYIQKAT